MLFVKSIKGTILRYFFACTKKATKKYTRGLLTSGLRGTVQNPCGGFIDKI